MDVWDYFRQRDREISAQSAAWDDDLGSPYVEELGSHGKRGRIFGRVILSDRAFLQVNEAVRVSGNHIECYEYAYFVVYEGAELSGYEHDPTHTPAVHRHDRHHNRYPSSTISFKDALSKAWQMIAAEEDLRETTERQSSGPDEE